MAEDFSELKLQVTFVDNASAQLKAIVGEVSKIDEIAKATKQGFREMTESASKFTDQLQKIGGILGDITKLPIGSLLGAGGIAGIAFGVKQINDQLSVFSREMINLQNNSRIAGILPDQFKSLQNQLVELGYTSQDASSELVSFFRTVDEAARPGTAQFQKIWAESFNPEATLARVKQLRDMIARGEGARAIEEAAREGQAIFERELTRPGGSRAEATRQMEAWFASIGLSTRAMNIRDLTDIVGDPGKWQRRIDAANSFNKEYEKFSEITSDVGAEIKTVLLPAFEDLNAWLVKNRGAFENLIPDTLRTDIEDIQKIIAILSGDWQKLGSLLPVGGWLRNMLMGNPRAAGEPQGPPTAFGEGPRGLAATPRSEGAGPIEFTPEQTERLQRRYRGRGPTAATPQRFMSGSPGTADRSMSAEAWHNMAAGVEGLSGEPSVNIERRDLTEEEVDQKKELTTNLKEINDALEYGEAPLGLLSTQLGGLRGGLGGGIGAGYGGYGAATSGGGTPGGAPPSGGTSITPGAAPPPAMVTPSAQPFPGGRTAMPPWGATTAGFGGGAGLGEAGGVQGLPGGPSGPAAPRGGGGAAPAGGGDPNAPLPGGSGSSAIYQKLRAAYQNSGLVGTIPKDGARYGFKTGSLEEWTRFGMIIAAAESDYNPKTAVSNRREQSFGIFQYNHPQVPGGNAFDVDASVRQFVADSKKSMETHGGFTPGSMLYQRFSTIQNTPPASRARQADATIAAAQRQQPQPSSVQQPSTTQQGTATGPPSPISGTLGQGLGAARGAYGGLHAHRHAGLDIMAPEGSPVSAMGPGTVIKSQFQPGATGGIVTVKYDNGYEAKYLHLSNWGQVRPGQRVGAGQTIGLSGYSPAARSAGAHLHYEIRDAQGNLVDPVAFHQFGQTGRTGEGVAGRQVYAGVAGSYSRGQRLAGQPPTGSNPPPPPSAPAVDVSKSLYEKLQQQETDVRALRRLREEREKIDDEDRWNKLAAESPTMGSFTLAARRQRLAGRGPFRTSMITDQDRTDVDRTEGRRIFHNVRGRASVDVTVGKSENKRDTPIEGPFKKIRMHGQHQHEPASSGAPPPTAANHDPGLDS